MLGITLVEIPLTFEHTKYPSIEEKMKNLIKDREEALAAHKLARNRMAGRKKDMFVPFEKGQKVWLDSRNLKTLYHKKIGPKWEGPFEIEEVLGPLTVRGHPPNPVSLMKSDNPALTSILTPYVPPHRQVHFKDLIVT